MKDYFTFRQSIDEKTSVKDLPNYKDRYRKGQARAYIQKKHLKNIDNLGALLMDIEGNYNIASFNGLASNPSEVELYGDMKVLQLIKKKIKGTEVYKN